MNRSTCSASSVTALGGLKRDRPEWAPWLAVVEELLRETSPGPWDAHVPEGLASRARGVPILAGTVIALPATAVRRLLERLIRAASLAGASRMTALEAVRPGLDMLTLFNASLCHDLEGVNELAAGAGMDSEALHAVAALLPVPFLHACHRRWPASEYASWVEGYCPVCGSRPAFAEVRGIERTRYFRCGRCGGAWHAQALTCPFCATSDHNELAALVPDKPGTQAVIEACRRCLGYVKTFTTLQGCAADAVMLRDLASVDLDMAALQHGYTRPAGAGYDLATTVTGTGASRGFFAWSQ